MGFNRNLVSHGSRCAEQSSFHAEHDCDFGFESFYGGVVAQHIVANLGGKHSFQHFGCRAGNGIAAEVNHFLEGFEGFEGFERFQSFRVSEFQCFNFFVTLSRSGVSGFEGIEGIEGIDEIEEVEKIEEIGCNGWVD